MKACELHVAAHQTMHCLWMMCMLFVLHGLRVQILLCLVIPSLSGLEQF